MTEPPPNPEEPKGDDAEPSVDLVVAPASKPTIIEDTSRGSTDQDKVRTEDFLTAEASTASRIVIRERYEAEFHVGSLPAPRTLRELKEIYEDAPRLIFEEFRAQSAHRRKIEESVITTKNKLAIRGQVIGGILGGIGLIGGLVVAGLGQELAGVVGVVASLGSLVYIFVRGREEQKKERLEKAKIQEEVKRGQPIEKLEGANSSGAKQTGEQHTARSSRPSKD